MAAVLTDTLSAPLHRYVSCIRHVTDSSSDSEGYADGFCDAFHVLAHNVAFLMGSGNVEEDEFVGSFVSSSVSPSQLGRLHV